MKRFAAHYIWYKQVYRMHYIELDDAGMFRGIYPLEEEIAGTAFYDGVLLPLLSMEPVIGFREIVDTWPGLTGKVIPGSMAHVYRLGGLPLASAKLGTDDGCSDGYVERL